MDDEVLTATIDALLATPGIATPLGGRIWPAAQAPPGSTKAPYPRCYIDQYVVSRDEWYGGVRDRMPLIQVLFVTNTQISESAVKDIQGWDAIADHAIMTGATGPHIAYARRWGTIPCYPSGDDDRIRYIHGGGIYEFKLAL